MANVELSTNTDITQQMQRANRADSSAIFAELAKFNSLASDTSTDHTADLKSSANTISALVQNLQQAAKGGDTNASAMLSKVQDGISKLNSSLYGVGSDLRLSLSSSGVQVSSVNVNGGQAPSSTTGQTQDWNSALAQDSSGQGFDFNGQTDQSVQDSPLFGIIKEAIEDVVKQLLTGAAGGAGSAAGGSSTSGTASTPATTTAGGSSAAGGSTTAGGSSAAGGSTTAGGSSAAGGSGSSTTAGGSSASGSGSTSGGSSASGSGSTSGGSSASGSGSGKRTSEELGNGSEAMQGLLQSNGFNMFMDALKKAADQKNGKQTKNNKGGKNAGGTQQQMQANNTNGTGLQADPTATGAGTGTGGGSGLGAGAGAGSGTGAGAGTGTGAGSAAGTGAGGAGKLSVPNGVETPGNPGTTGVANGDNYPIANAGGSNVPNDSGAAGDPMLCNANINGILMMVLLECYKDGQKDLLAQAQRMQDINNQKKSIRSDLAADRAGGDSTKEQNDTDKLQSLGDDSQMMQLNLQNMAQNQQQLLQMISNFSKNVHDNSMAIIRHIGGG